MKQAIHCNLLHGKPVTDINVCLDKIYLTVVNIEVIFIIFENVGGFPQLSFIDVCQLRLRHVKFHLVL